jgi:predicted DCC family thiol-disulfide oxidoreductase YuxK
MQADSGRTSILARLIDSREWLFYDGGCRLCRGATRFVRKRDRETHFRAAPLEGTIFLAEVPAASRAGLPDSLVLLTREGALLTQSDACICVLRRLGGVWKALAMLLAPVPKPLRDRAYCAVARMRFVLFGRIANELRDDRV